MERLRGLEAAGAFHTDTNLQFPLQFPEWDSERSTITCCEPSWLGHKAPRWPH